MKGTIFSRVYDMDPVGIQGCDAFQIKELGAIMEDNTEDPSLAREEGTDSMAHGGP